MKDHVEIGKNLGSFDFDSAGRISGSRFSVIRGSLAALQRALIQFMLDLHTREHDYEEFYVPYIVQSDALIGTSQLPKFESDLFKRPDFLNSMRRSKWGEIEDGVLRIIKRLKDHSHLKLFGYHTHLGRASREPQMFGAISFECAKSISNIFQVDFQSSLEL